MENNYHVIITFGVVLCTSFIPINAELGDPPNLMVKEIQRMARNIRNPKIILDMLEGCETYKAEEKEKIKKEYGNCILPFYAKDFSTAIGLRRLIDDCNIFSQANKCYTPIRNAVNSCFGVGSDSFQFTTALWDYICENKESTIEQIQSNSQKFLAFDESVESNVDVCLVNEYRNNPHERNETCKGLDIVEHCLNKYLVKQSDSEMGERTNFFKSLLTYISKELRCGMASTPFTTTTRPLLNATGKIEKEVSGSDNSSYTFDSSGHKTIFLVSLVILIIG